MWLMYPLSDEHIRSARRGVLALLAASATWYLTFAVVLAVWTNPVMDKIRNKFSDAPTPETNWIPFLILLVAFTLAGALRALGYRLSRNVTGAIAHPEASTVATLGVALWLAAAGTIYIGFTGLLALVAALGTALELRFLRYPSTLFGLVVSQSAASKVAWYFRIRTMWLLVVVVASFVILVSHGVNDIPRNPGGPYEVSIIRVTTALHTAFKVLASIALVTLPIMVMSYWMMLFTVYATVGRLLDPNGPIPQPEPPKRPGFDQLKTVLQPQSW